MATSLIAPVLGLCDRDGIAAYLETQNPDNVSFYMRRGCVVVDEVDIPGDGHHLWLMIREPATKQRG